MTAFGKTIVGRILKGAAKVVLPVVGAVTGVGAISGAAKGIGALAGVGETVKKIGGGVKSVIDKVSASAVKVFTGANAEEWKQVRDIKARTKAETDKWEQVDRLVRAGASRAEAMLTVGVSDEGVTLTDYQGLENKPGISQKTMYIAGAALAALVFLPKLLKRR